VSTAITNDLKKDQIPFNNYRFAFLVILLGIVIRLFACEYTYIINSDGLLYIHQARALYYNSLDNLYNCGLNYLSIYPRFISLFYLFTGDFLSAAITVSALFGCLTLIPVYFLSRRFFSIQISSLVTLIFALLPIFVGRSADVLRGPLGWFFLAWGILLFVQFVDSKKWQYLILCLICFALATLSRIEAVVSFPSAMLALFLISHNRIKVFYSIVGVLVGIVIIGFCFQVFAGISIWKLYRFDEVSSKFIEPYKQYNVLREKLHELRKENNYMELEDHFIVNARHQVHFVAIGTVLNNACEAFFYPFFLLFILGIGPALRKLKDDPRLWFFLIMPVLGLSVVFVHLVQHWMIEYRYFAIIILSSSVFAGFGIIKAKDLLIHKDRMKPKHAIIWIFIFIFAFGLGKNLKSREKDKYIFRLMGETIAAIEPLDPPYSVFSLQKSTNCEKVHFYANRYHEGVLCPRQTTNFIQESDGTYASLVNLFIENNMQYFLWEKRLWPEDWFDFNKSFTKNDFVPVMRHKASDKTDSLILYRFVGDL